VKRLVDMQKPAGQHQITWDATNDLGQPVAAGLYFCRMQAEKFTDVIKLALVK
jgi:flagellar hook assembly protein FlgD